ncbi:MAG: nucleotidyltransferase [Chitinophagaceae bacterium]|nr:MAG: nucleotidyltransferase [Chitinophagaceae bacterium]
MKLEQKKIEKIKDYLSKCPVEKAWLFGSYVHEEANRNSDIDLLLDLDYSKRIGLKFVQMKLDLEEMLGQEVDLVSSNGLSKYIKPFIDKEKLLIYER